MLLLVSKSTPSTCSRGHLRTSLLNHMLHHPPCSLCWMIPSHMQKYALVPSILDSQTNPPFPVYPVSPFSALLCHETSFKIGALPLPHQLVACLPPAAWLLALSLHWVHSAVTSLVPEVRMLRCSSLAQPLGIIWTKYPSLLLEGTSWLL